MKRIVLFAAALLGVTLAIWLAGHALYAPPKHPVDDTPWPYALGRLRDVPKRYPSQDVSTNAAEVTRLAAALDIDLQQQTTRPRGPSRLLPLRATMREYLDRPLIAAGDHTEPMP